MRSLAIGLAAVLLTMLALVVADRLQGRRYQASKEASVVVTYPVDDLVRGPAQTGAPNDQPAPRVDMGPLIDIITSTVAPGTWQVEGKPSKPSASGTITPFYANNSLIVRHSSQVQTQVRERLKQLRSLPALKGVKD